MTLSYEATLQVLHDAFVRVGRAGRRVLSWRYDVHPAVDARRGDQPRNPHSWQG
jgi:hypothetical protein